MPTSRTVPPICRTFCGPRSDADLVIGSRYVTGSGVDDWGPWRRFLSRSGNAYARNTLGIGIRDLTGGFKCFRRQALKAIDFEAITARGYVYQVELPFRALRAGFRVVEVPIVFHERQVQDDDADRRRGDLGGSDDEAEAPRCASTRRRSGWVQER